ncbi:REJ domain-containing protein [Marivirga sericea]|uniref:REJ domain-containing protein n=1 Tax=Marivirga sericea TaxID=1028 RepID=A0A1X7K4F7_9BACT|nr:right-handed parallel beta-helix repeat-containing protein [Marivirga sericea]SMG35594.1 REJ domain-containing protein [Marivirga sericea]
MKATIRTIQLLICLSITFALTNCKKDEEVNEAPSSDAGDDISIALGEAATLDGSGSTDPENAELSYAWAIVNAPAGSSADVDEPTNTQTTFTPDVDGEYEISLTVIDDGENSATDNLLVTVLSNPPMATIGGEDIEVIVGNEVMLDGSGSSDPDNDDLSFSWTFESTPSESSVAISNDDQDMASFTPDVVGDYVVLLTVTDSKTGPVTDQVTITATNEVPTAVAGEDLEVFVDDEQTLDATTSSDPDGHELTYSWTITNAPDASTATITNADQATATFTPDEQGDFLITLSVTDGYSDPVTDEILISATYPGAPPAADAGENKCSIPGRIVLPDGSASSDPDGDAITYSWSVAEGPSNANSSITAETSASPEFTTDEAGQYFLALEVSDGIWDPVYDTVELNIFIPTVINATITEETTIPNLCDDPDVPDAYLEGTESVRAILTFESGVRMEADADTHLEMENGGRLIAEGTSTDTIVFIGKTDEKAFWQGLIFRDNTNSILDYVKISSSGRETTLQGTAAIYTSTNGTFNLTNSKLSNNEGYGVQANSNGENILNLSNVEFSDNTSNGLYLTPKDLVNVASNLTFSNNGDDRILMNGTRTSNDGTWPAYNYLVDGSLIVNSDVEIEAGAVFELDMAYIWVDNVTFDAIGTADNPIIFTAETQQPGNWFGIQYRGTSRGTFDYVEVSYAGDGSDPDNANIELCNSQFTITNSTISNGAKYGIFVNDEVIINSDYQTTNEFSNNVSGPVFTSGACPPLQ